MGEQQEVTVQLIGLPVAAYQRAAEHHDALRRELELIHRSDRDDEMPAGLRELVRELAERFDAFAPTPRAGIERALHERTDDSADVANLDYRVTIESARSAQRLLELFDDADAYCRTGGYLVTVESSPEGQALRAWVLGQFADQAGGAPPTSWPDWQAQHGVASGAPKPPQWTATVEGSTAQVVLSGELDIDVSPRLRDFFNELSSQDVTVVMADCAAVTFIDSVGLSVLISAHRRCEEEGGRVEITNPSRVVAGTLEIAGLGAFFGVD